MKYIGISLDFLESVEMVQAKPLHIATWLKLNTFCAKKENGGRIVDAARMDSRTMLIIVGVDKKVVMRNSPLWSWDGADLILFGYNTDNESRVRTNRENGRLGGRPVKPKVNPSDNQPVNQLAGEREREREIEKEILLVSPTAEDDQPLTPEGTPSPKGKQTRMARPSLEDTTEFMSTVGGDANMAQDFQDYYESKGWKVGREPMKDWKAAARRWVRNNITRTVSNLRLQNFDPPSHALPITRIIIDRQDKQEWMSGDKHWERILGHMEQVK